MASAQDKIETIKEHYRRTPFDFQEIRREIFRVSLTFEALQRQGFNGGKVVDVGCSTSYLGEVLREGYPDVEYLGVDLNSGAVAAAREKGLNVVEGNNLSLDLPDGCADLTVSEGVIHHTPDPMQCFLELIRITKPGGLISLYVYDRNHIYYWIYKAGAAVRLLNRGAVGGKAVEKVVFPLFNIFCIQLGNRIYFQNREIVSRDVAWNIFSDMILTPVAHFFTKRQISDAAQENGLETLRFKPSINRQGLMFLFRKQR